MRSAGTIVDRLDEVKSPFARSGVIPCQNRLNCGPDPGDEAADREKPVKKKAVEKKSRWRKKWKKSPA